MPGTGKINNILFFFFFKEYTLRRKKDNPCPQSTHSLIEESSIKTKNSLMKTIIL